MSQKSQPRCVVVVEPMSKVMEEKMESALKDPIKKKLSKEEKKAASAAKEAAAAEATSSSAQTPGKEAESAPQTQENGTGNIVNGKGSKKDKSSKRDKSPAVTADKPAPEKSADKPATAKPADKPTTAKPADKTTAVTNGVSDVAINSTAAEGEASGVAEGAGDLNPEIIEDDALAQNPEADNDELFPELNYDENSDNECSFDSASPNFSPVGRSATRRSQAKKIPTPETPQLPAAKGDTPEVVEVSRSPARHTPDHTTPLREKVFKMKDIYTPRQLDSARKNRDTESPVAGKEEGTDSKNESAAASELGSAKLDTNFSKSRIKVSPYRRSSRISEQYSIMANYSGNNTTQQTELIGDISSSSRDPSGDAEQSGDCSQGERSFSDSFKHIKGRRSYRHLREISFRNLSAQRHQRENREEGQESEDASVSSVNATQGSQSPCDTVSSESSAKWTPVGHVVGRKRRQGSCEEEPSHLPPHAVSPALVLGGDSEERPQERPSKRMRLLGYVSTPLRQLREKMASSTPIQLSGRSSYKPDPLLVPSGDETVTVEEEMPMVADIVHCKEGGPEHKWCSIM